MHYHYQRKLHLSNIYQSHAKFKATLRTLARHRLCSEEIHRPLSKMDRAGKSYSTQARSPSWAKRSAAGRQKQVPCFRRAGLKQRQWSLERGDRILWVMTWRQMVILPTWRDISSRNFRGRNFTLKFRKLPPGKPKKCSAEEETWTEYREQEQKTGELNYAGFDQCHNGESTDLYLLSKSDCPVIRLSFWK